MQCAMLRRRPSANPKRRADQRAVERPIDPDQKSNSFASRQLQKRLTSASRDDSSPRYKVHQGDSPRFRQPLAGPKRLQGRQNFNYRHLTHSFVCVKLSVDPKSRIRDLFFLSPTLATLVPAFGAQRVVRDRCPVIRPLTSTGKAPQSISDGAFLVKCGAIAHR